MEDKLMEVFVAIGFDEDNMGVLAINTDKDKLIEIVENYGWTQNLTKENAHKYCGEYFIDNGYVNAGIVKYAVIKADEDDIK